MMPAYKHAAWRCNLSQIEFALKPLSDTVLVYIRHEEKEQAVLLGTYAQEFLKARQASEAELTKI